jgi:molybdopterin-guanine dinucleotide biosynthesis protein A
MTLLRFEGKPLGAVVLAGGDSRRMGENKAFLSVQGKTLIQHILDQIDRLFDEILISASRRDEFDHLGYQVVLDESPGEGPMAAIKGALSAAQFEKNFVIACDIPDINLAFLDNLIESAASYEIVVPVSPQNKYEPLFAVYSRSTISPMQGLLEKGERSLLPLFKLCLTQFISLGPNNWFKNLNTREDYEAYISRFKV